MIKVGNYQGEYRPLKDWSTRELREELRCMNREDAKGIFDPEPEARAKVDAELRRRKAAQR